MGWRTWLSRQCFHGKHTLASHYTLSDIRGSLLARGGKRADYFYPRIDVSPTLVYLLGRREREIEKRLGSLFRLKS